MANPTISTETPVLAPSTSAGPAPAVAGSLPAAPPNGNGAAPPALPLPTPPPATGLTGDDGQPLDTQQLKARLDRAAEKARQDVLTRLGYKSMEEAEQRTAAEAEARKASEEARKAQLSVEQRLQEERDTERRRAEAAEAKAAELEQRVVRDEAMKETRAIALAAGVRPEAFEDAFGAFERHIRSVPADQIQGDEDRRFFADLKSKKPFFFTDGGAPPAAAPVVAAAPAAGATTGLVGGDGSTPPPVTPPSDPEVDAFKMDRKTWTEHLRKHGGAV